MRIELYLRKSKSSNKKAFKKSRKTTHEWKKYGLDKISLNSCLRYNCFKERKNGESYHKRVSRRVQKLLLRTFHSSNKLGMSFNNVKVLFGLILTRRRYCVI